MMLTTSISATSWMLSVLANTAVSRANVSPLFPCFLQVCSMQHSRHNQLLYRYIKAKPLSSCVDLPVAEVLCKWKRQVHQNKLVQVTLGHRQAKEHCHRAG